MAFVGRRTELDLLEREVALAAQASAGRAVFIVGPPGAGKTALAAAFLDGLAATRPELSIARGRCLQTFGSADPYLPFVDALRDLSDESTAGHVQKERISSLITELAPYWLSVVPMVGSLLSAGFATAARLRGGGAGAAPSREALFVQYLEVIRKLAQQSPLLLFLDDLHWADQSSVALLAHLARGISTLPVVIVGTLRSDEAELDGHPVVNLIRELEREDLARRVEVGDLGSDALRALLAAEFGGDLAEPLVRWVTETAGGNPLFATELARLLKQSGAAVEERGEWQLTDSVRALEVPRSAEAVIETRISRLDAEEVRVLQYASVDGNEFNSVVLSRLLDKDELELLDTLERLERRYQLVRTTGEVELPDGEIATTLAFRHALVQTVLYKQVLGKRRILLHRKCAEILQTSYGERTDAVAGKLARHFHEGQVPASAHQYACLAADAARKVYAHWEAEEMYRLALSHAPEPGERVRLQERLGDVYDAVGYYRQGIASYHAALSGSPDPNAGLRLRRKVLLLERKAGLVPAPMLLQRVRTLQQEAHGSPEELCHLLLETSMLPDATGVLAAVQEALAIAEALDHRSLRLQALERLAFVLIFFAGRHAEGLSWLQRAQEIVDASGDPLRGARCREVRGIALAKLGRFSDAQREFTEVLHMAERIGDPRRIGVACNNLGCLLLRLGEFAEAEEYLERARAIRERRDRAGLVQQFFNLAERARLTGEFTLAAERYRQMLALAEELEYWNSEAVAQAGLGLCHLALGEPAPARECARRTLAAMADRQEWFEDRDLVEILLAHVHLLDGEPARALTRLERAAAALREHDVYLWARVELERAAVLSRSHAAGARDVVEEVAQATVEVQSPPLHAQVAALRERLAAQALPVPMAAP